MPDRREIVRTIAEECWSDSAGLARMRGYLAPDYVHHTPFGDRDADGFAWADGRLADRVYSVEHVVGEGPMAAAFVSWTGVRRDDGGRIEGRGAYHCRFEGDRLAEDWDVFHPLG